MTPRRGVVGGGSFIVDILKSIDRYPPEEGLALVQAQGRACGGPGFNILADLRLMGADFPLAAMGLIGADDNGDFIARTLAGLAIDAGRLRARQDAPTASVDVMTARGTGRRTFFYAAGVADLLATEDLDPAGLSHRIFHCGAPGLHAGMDAPDADGETGFSRALRAAQAAGMLTTMELVTLAPERQAALVTPCLQHLDSLIVNEMEAGPVAGVDLRPGGRIDWTAAERACIALRARGPRRLVAIHFPEGAVAVGAEGEPLRQGSVRLPAADIRSAVGAGDAFAAGMVFAWHEGWPLDRALRLAVAVAAQSLRGETTTDAILPWRDCLAAAEALGHRDAA
jgi:sugar/nucleoside kinase (ribokinase family)